jgi:hypothetical protein
MTVTVAVTARLVPIAAFAGLASLAGCGACEPDRGPPPGASASASAPVPAPPSASTLPFPLGSRVHAPKVACRAIAVDGDVHLDTGADAGLTPLLLDGLVPTEGWLALAPGAHFVAKDPRTTRETTFRGAGRARACVALAEESWIAAGGFDSSVGAGETPGAEEWVVTPFGVVRYSAAKVSIDVHARDARVTVTGGGAFAWPAADVTAKALNAGAPGSVAGGGAPPSPLAKTDDGWLRADAGLTFGAASPPASVDTARAAVTQCEALGKEAHDLGAVVMAGGADAGTIAVQVGTRRLARAACAVAALRTGALPASTPADTLAPLNKGLTEASAAWSTVPSPP